VGWGVAGSFDGTYFVDFAVAATDDVQQVVDQAIKCHDCMNDTGQLGSQFSTTLDKESKRLWLALPLRGSAHWVKVKVAVHETEEDLGWHR
jgi:hypothetical protein